MGFRKLFRGGAAEETAALYECRDCGESVPADAEECPTCGSTEIATYSSAGLR